MPVSAADNLDERLRQRETILRHPLETVPVANIPRGNIPNTPLAVSIIAFLLGAIFSLGALLFVVGGLDVDWRPAYQLGFFVAAWAGFHWAEFAVTAGWNFEKCSVDCEHKFLSPGTSLYQRMSPAFLLDNGAMYHVANGTALTEYLLTLYFKPSLKSYPYISAIGKKPWYCHENRRCSRIRARRYSHGCSWTNFAINGNDPCLNKLFTFRCLP